MTKKTVDVACGSRSWLDRFHVMSLATRLGWGAWLLALGATSASAQATTRLDWQRADTATTCIDGVELEAAVEAQLDADALSSAVDAAIVIVGRVERTDQPRGFRAVVSVLRNGHVSGVRDVVIRGRDCRKLDDALVLVIAMALEQPSSAPSSPNDAPSISGGPSSEPSASPTPIAGSVPVLSNAADATAAIDMPAPPTNSPPVRSQQERAQPVEGSARVQAPRRPRRPTHARPEPTPRVVPDVAAERDAGAGRDDAASIEDERDDASLARWSLSAGGAISHGWMPGPAAGANAALGWHASERWAVEIAGMWWPAGEQPTDAGSLHFVIGYGQARLCPTLVRAQIWVDACAGISVGAIIAEGRNFDRDNRSDRRLLLGASLLGRVSKRIAGAWHVRGALALDLPWLRDRYFVQLANGDRVQLHRLAALVGALGLELVAQL